MKVIVCLVVIGVIVGAVSCGVSEGPNLEKPCGSSTPISVGCVRNYFESNAECSVITDSNNEPVYRPRHFFYVPSAGLMGIDHDSELGNLNGTIEKFYINKDSGNLVMTISLENVTYQSLCSHLHFTREEEQSEPFRITDSVKANYPYKMTGVIPLDDKKITDASVKEAMVISDFPKPIEVEFGPKISESSDPDVLRTKAAFKENGTVAIREIFYTEGPSHFQKYLYKHICDFDNYL